MIKYVIKRHQFYLNRCGFEKSKLNAIEHSKLHISVSRASKVAFQYVEPLQKLLKPITNQL